MHSLDYTCRNCGRTQGEKLPLAGRIQITIIEKEQAVWLAFAKRELELLERLPAQFVEQ